MEIILKNNETYPIRVLLKDKTRIIFPKTSIKLNITRSEYKRLLLEHHELVIKEYIRIDVSSIINENKILRERVKFLEAGYSKSQSELVSENALLKEKIKSLEEDLSNAQKGIPYIDSSLLNELAVVTSEKKRLVLLEKIIEDNVTLRKELEAL